MANCIRGKRALCPLALQASIPALWLSNVSTSAEVRHRAKRSVPKQWQLDNTASYVCWNKEDYIVNHEGVYGGAWADSRLIMMITKSSVNRRTFKWCCWRNKLYLCKLWKGALNCHDILYHGVPCRELCISQKTWWRHQMETFSALLALCARNSPVTGDFPSQGPVTRSFDVFSLICAWINAWVNKREVDDLSRHRAHYDITLISTEELWNYAIWKLLDKINQILLN